MRTDAMGYEFATFFDDVAEFHEKFDLPTAVDGPPKLIAGELDGDDLFALYRATALVEEARDLLRKRSHVALYRAAFALEEKAEYLRAVFAEDLPAIADALVDSVFIDLGTAHFYRINFEDVWDEVCRANLSKERGPTPARDHHLDVRKPADFVPPDVAGCLRAAGWLG